MDQAKLDNLARGGIQAADALERFMGSDALLERFLKRFLEDATYSGLCQAVEAGDWQQALAASHTLKGMCGNLSMTELYDLFTRQVALLREDKPADAAALMPAIEAAYRRAADAIGQL